MTPPPLLDARALAAAVVGPVTRVEPMNGFVGNQTFRLRTASRETVYPKSGDTVEAEAHGDLHPRHLYPTATNSPA